MMSNHISATSNKVIDGLALLLAALFAFPILGQAVPVVNALPGDLTSYSMLLVVPLALGSLLWGVRWNNFNRTQKALLAFCLYSIAVETIMFAIYGIGPNRIGLQMYRTRTLGSWFLLALFWIFSAIRGSAQRERFLKRFAQGIALVFALQLFLSLNESLTGDIIQRDPDMLSSSYESRDMFSDTSSGGISALGLHYSLNGMIYFFDLYGVQLIFYNLLFLTQLTQRIRWLYVFLCVCALGAAILNTTKTGIITIAISDIAFIALQEGRFRILRSVSVIISSVILLLIYGPILLDEVFYAGKGMLTWNLRVEQWHFMLIQYKEYVFAEPWSIPIGFNYRDNFEYTTKITGTLNGSTQNEFLLQLLSGGVIGLALFLYAFFITPIWSYREVPRQKMIAYWLLPLCLLLASITMDLQTTCYVFPLIAFIGLYFGSAREERYLPDRRQRAALAGVTAPNACPPNCGNVKSNTSIQSPLA
jgi:hypothetical protein